jgi:ligand-binding sensor domain-containing protein
MPRLAICTPRARRQLLGPALRAEKLVMRRTPCAHLLLLLTIVFFSSVSQMAALDPSHRISQYGHTSWRIQDGYFGGQAVSIAQTTDGYLWIGTPAGVFRFDGAQFVPWNSLSREQLPSNDIHFLFGARDGSLWIATDSGLLRWVNQRSIRYLSGDVIGSIMEDEKGQIWFTHDVPGDHSHPICRIVDIDVRCYGYGAGEGILMSAFPLVEDSSGNLWVGHDTAVVRWRDGSVKAYPRRSA